MSGVFHVVDPGLLTTVQDLGRLGAIAGGVPPGGAMDRFAHRAANLIVGNPPGDATLECTLRGPAVIAETECVVAVTGAPFTVTVNKSLVPMWTAVDLRAGDRLALGARLGGARAYIAVGGGFEGDRWLGSRSTLTVAQRGGLRGRALVAGDVLEAAAKRPTAAGRTLDPSLRPSYGSHLLQAMTGPHHRRLDPDSRRALFSQPFTVSPQSDRMGFRLDGPVLAAPGDEVLSFGLVFGAVQLPPGGRPILLMADHQTAGGYPVVATVVSASLPLAAQLAPGHDVRFELVTEARARAARLALNQALASLAAAP
jgi:antagonist of KipI